MTTTILCIQQTLEKRLVMIVGGKNDSGRDGGREQRNIFFLLVAIYLLKAGRLLIPGR